MLSNATLEMYSIERDGDDYDDDDDDDDIDDEGDKDDDCDDNCPAVVMIIMSTHFLHPACSSLLQLKSKKGDDDERRDDDLVATLPARLLFGEGVGGVYGDRRCWLR